MLPCPTVWVAISLAAGLLQTARNGLARSLSGILPATLLSWSRFAFNLPFALALAGGLYLLRSDGAPELSARFFALCAVGGAGQILGNVVLIEAFRWSVTLAVLVSSLDPEHGGRPGENPEDRGAGAVDELRSGDPDLATRDRLAGIDGFDGVPVSSDQVLDESKRNILLVL